MKKLIEKIKKNREILALSQRRGIKENFQKKAFRQLAPLWDTCMSCSMCVLGLKEIKHDNCTLDPHVFSNMRPNKIMIVGQNPGSRECVSREPFVGLSGEIFSKEINKHGLSRNDFYITNVCKCFTIDNRPPSIKYIKKCKPFLQMEVNILRPRLIVVLGGVAFKALCPNDTFSLNFEKLVDSVVGVPVMPIYHPSPLNLNNEKKRSMFDAQIQTMCKLVIAFKNRIK